MEKAKNRKKNFTAIALFVIMLGSSLVLFYHMPELIAPVLATLIGISIVFLIWKAIHGPGSVKELLKQKRKILKEISITEKEFFKRRLSEKDYREMMQQKQTELIKIEGKIAGIESKKSLKEEKTTNLAKNKQHALKKLLEEKKRLSDERKLIDIKFHKRKINQQIYEQLVKKNKKEEVETEASIQQIYSEKTIDEIMTGLKNRLKELEKEKKIRAKGEKQIMEEDIIESVSEE